jgi:hypothetical protein
MVLSPVQSCLFDVKAKNLCQFEKFVFTITTKSFLQCSSFIESVERILTSGKRGKALKINFIDELHAHFDSFSPLRNCNFLSFSATLTLCLGHSKTTRKKAACDVNNYWRP